MFCFGLLPPEVGQEALEIKGDSLTQGRITCFSGKLEQNLPVCIAVCSCVV